ncbi:MAG TPA: DUF2085 domain-containing protein [Roseiflexaceae bacterium]|nr:DUF2085 domain-containing protein [Roseiflexaceae bacterium]
MTSSNRPVTPSPPQLVGARLLKAILVVLFFGPLIAPLFQATNLPLAADSGALARDLLSRYICPTPAKSYVVLGFPMAVCARCWGATIGLWVAWLVFRASTRDSGCPLATSPTRPLTIRLVEAYLELVWPLRLLVGALPFLLWIAEIRWWPAASYWMLLNGAFAGFWAGLFCCSIWPGLLQSRTYAMCEASFH